jgi:hypothetical protein
MIAAKKLIELQQILEALSNTALEDSLSEISLHVGDLAAKISLRVGELSAKVERDAKSADAAADALDWIRKVVLDDSATDAQVRADIRMILATAAASLTGDPTLTTRDSSAEAVQS